MTLKRHKVAQFRRVELTSSEFQAQKVTLTDHQVPSPFVFQGEGGGWGYSLGLQVYLFPLNDFELQVYYALLGE